MPTTATAPAPHITLEQQIASIIREIAMRERVYPNWVSARKMSQDKADHELAAMRAVLGTVNDYVDMQPKVLALSAVALSLAERAGMDKAAFDAMLVRAEATAKVELEKARSGA